MKKDIKLLLLLFVITSLIINKPSKIHADEKYSFNCNGQYEVAWINDSGTFDKVGCYPDFNSAKAKMKELGGDHVVRHQNSLSPTKIIAMNSGNAYSYPARNNSSTMNIYEHVSERSEIYKKTYIANHYEMLYLDTERYNVNSGTGMIEVVMNGFSGFTDLEFTDLVPSKFINRGLSIWLGGNDKTDQNEQAFLVIVRNNRYYVQEKDGYRELVFEGHRSYNNNANNNGNYYDEYSSYVIGIAPKEMQTGINYYSYNGYDFYTNTYYDNKAFTYYPYYQFLPIRSTTNLTATQLDNAFNKIKGNISSAMKNHGQDFIDAQNEYGVNALLLYAMGAHESNWGTSKIAIEKNNLFGWNAVDADPSQASKFANVKDGIMQHAGYNLRGYADIFDARFFSMSLGNKGSGFNVKYASDPYWGMGIASIAYRIDKINSANNNLNDFNKYTLGIVDEFDAKFYKDTNTDHVMYTAAYGPSYQKGFINIILEESQDYTKVQSTNPIIDNNIRVYCSGSGTSYKSQCNDDANKTKLVKYDFNNSVVYLKSSSITKLSEGFEKVPEASGDYVGTISDFRWNEDKLFIKGQAYVPGIIIDDENRIVNKLELYNDNISKIYDLNTKVENEEATFEAQLDLSNLAEGSYRFRIITTYSKWSKYDNKFDIKNVDLLPSKIIDNYNYNFDLIQNYIQLNKKEFNEATIRKVSILSQLDIDQNGILSIDGIAFRTGLDYIVKENIKHSLEIYDASNDEIVKSYDLSTYEYKGLNLNDGFKYVYIGFRANIDISQYNNGTYYLKVRVDNDNDTQVINLNSYEFEDQLKVFTNEETLYKISTNSNYGRRFEIDIDYNLIDYSKVNKISYVDSLASFENIKIEDGKLNIKGFGYIDKINFSKDNNPNYKLLLISNKGKLISFDTNNYKCKFNYASLVNKTKNMDNACFDIEIDLSNLEKDTYKFFVEISSNDKDKVYYDIAKIIDLQKVTNINNTYNNRNYSLKVLDDRCLINLVIE